MERNNKGQFIKGCTPNRWNGGVTHDRYGYKKILKPNHPLSDSKGYVAEHRYLMCEKLGRIITKDEVVHHIDGNKTNNAIDNLQLMNHFEHKSIHWIGKKRVSKQRDSTCVLCHRTFASFSNTAKYCPTCKTKTCKQCGKTYTNTNDSFCSLSCRNLYLVGKQPKNTDGLKLGRMYWIGKSNTHSPKGKDHWNYKERVEQTCEWCHKLYKRTPNAQKKKRFCSSSCRYAWCSHRMTINNPAKHGDISKSQ